MADGTPRRRWDSLALEAFFRARLAELGAELLESEWLGAHGKHEARCSAGHICYPTPAAVRRGRGICATCAGKDPAAAEAVFRDWLAELGATPLFDSYRGYEHGHEVLCANGHACYARPRARRDGEGICVICAGKDPHVSEAAFRRRIAELGATVLGPYVNSKTKVHVRCVAGHDCYQRPETVKQGCGICRICARQDPATAEAQFRENLATLGAELLEPYTNSVTPHHVRCAQGHDWYPRPAQLQHRGGICGVCAGKDSAAVEAAFRRRLAEHGATLLEPVWLGSGTPHRVLCSQGHLCTPTPGNVGQGCGPCRFCAGAEWDVFYVVTDGSTVKFGITSGEPQRRLLIHAKRGYRDVLLVAAGLPGTVALDTENAVKSALALAGEKPSQGREYFDISCLALILDVAASWLGDAAAA